LYLVFSASLRLCGSKSLPSLARVIEFKRRDNLHGGNTLMSLAKVAASGLPLVSAG
jgi:hypothetical protein